MVNEFPFGTSQSGKRDYLLRISVCPLNVPVEGIKNRFPFTSQSEFSGICGEWLTTTVTEKCTINVISSSNQRGRNCLPKWTFVRSFAPDFLDVFGQNCSLFQGAIFGQEVKTWSVVSKIWRAWHCISRKAGKKQIWFCFSGKFCKGECKCCNKKVERRVCRSQTPVRIRSGHPEQSRPSSSNLLGSAPDIRY